MRVLVVEDDALLGDALQAGLKQAGFVADWLRDGAQAQQALDGESFAAVVLDLGLPGKSGIQVLRAWRSQGRKTPVLILTARDTVDDRIAGLDAGADDYLIKPFDMGELCARLRALIRRAEGRPSPVLEVQGVRLDPAAHTASLDGTPLDLSGKEFALLHVLLLNAGRVLSKPQLEQHLYAWGEEIGSNTVEVYVHHLRRKLGRDLIKTIRGVGYVVPRKSD